MEEKQDLRTLRTKNALKSVLKELLLSKDFENISVKEVCEKAEINRRTFYLHYDTIDDLLMEILDDISAEFNEYSKGYDHLKNIERIVSDYFHFTSTNPLYEKLNLNLNLTYLRDQVSTKFVPKAHDSLKSLDDYDEFTSFAFATFLNSNTVNMYRHWYRNKNKISMQEAIDLTIDLIENGFTNYFNK